MNKKQYIISFFLVASLVFLLLFFQNVMRKQKEPTPISTEITRTSTPLATNQNPTSQTQSEEISGPLFVNPDNPRYFTDGIKVSGKYRAIYLTGSHTWCDFMDCGVSSPPSAFDYAGFLDFLSRYNFNFVRLWRAENSRGGENGDGFWFDPMPYQRSATVFCAFDGGNKFDLNQFNQAYFDRMRERIIQAEDRGIYVSVMLFDGWSIEHKSPPNHEPWKGHPYNLSNNINGINGDLNNDSQGSETHSLSSNQITALQEAYVRKVIDTINDLNNVLYEISNESSKDSTTWQYHMIDYVKAYEAGKLKQHPVGMVVEHPGGSNEELFASSADWISPNGDVNNPPVADGSKVILADTDHLCGLCGDQQSVWKSFTRGQNPLFMDPYSEVQIGRGAPSGYDPNNTNDTSLRLSLGYARSYATRMNLTSMTPLPDLCSTSYCLGNPVADGAEYLIFLPSGGTVSNLLTQLEIDRDIHLDLPSDSTVYVDLSSSPVELTVDWFNPMDGTTVDGGIVLGGTTQSFTAPFSGDAVLYIYDTNEQ